MLNSVLIAYFKINESPRDVFSLPLENIGKLCIL